MSTRSPRPPVTRQTWIVLGACVLTSAIWALLPGCGHKPATIRPVTTAPTAQLTEPVVNPHVEAYVVPPVGWRADPPKQTGRHHHQTWLSPTGRTAYGIIHFKLPLPVGHDLALWGFLQEMKRSEGEAVLVSKQWDENLPGLRFVADGGLYRVRANLFVRGWQGWAVYAGTLRKEPLMPEELDLAERAREHTAVGLGDGADRAPSPTTAATAVRHGS